jgi:hypothetical protein
MQAMNRTTLRKWFSQYKGNEGVDSMSHNYLLVKLRARLNPHLVKQFEDTVYQNKGRWFIPHGQSEELVELMSK